MEKLAGNKDQAGIAASEGTFQHHVAALCLENKRAAESYIGYQEKVDGIDFTFERGPRPHGAGLSRHGLGSCW